MPAGWQSWNVSDPSRPLVLDTSAGQGMAAAGSILQISGALMGAVGSYFAADAQRHELKSQALSMEFEGRISAINARAAERDVAAIFEASRQELQLRDLQSAAEKAALKTDAAARGVQVGAGSSAELNASEELRRQIDARTVRTNAARAMGNRTIEATNLRNRGLLANVSARNLRASARSISPALAASGGLLGSVGAVASNWAQNQRDDARWGRR